MRTFFPLSPDDSRSYEGVRRSAEIAFFSRRGVVVLFYTYAQYCRMSASRHLIVKMAD